MKKLKLIQYIKICILKVDKFLSNEDLLKEKLQNLHTYNSKFKVRKQLLILLLIVIAIVLYAVIDTSISFYRLKQAANESIRLTKEIDENIQQTNDTLTIVQELRAKENLNSYESQLLYESLNKLRKACKDDYKCRDLVNKL